MGEREGEKESECLRDREGETERERGERERDKERGNQYVLLHTHIKFVKYFCRHHERNTTE